MCTASWVFPVHPSYKFLPCVLHPPSHPRHSPPPPSQKKDPGAYGKLGLSDLFEMREECLREFGFSDVYRLDKDKENALALQVRGVLGTPPP